MKYRALLTHGTRPGEKAQQEFSNTLENIAHWADVVIAGVDAKEFPDAQIVITQIVEQVVKVVKRV